MVRLKADPYAFHAETRPGTASKLYTIDGYAWGDEAWRKKRHGQPGDGQELDEVEAHVLDVRGKLTGQVPVVDEVPVLPAAPGAQVDLVDVQS